jgi:hypothetical protein
MQAPRRASRLIDGKTVGRHERLSITVLQHLFVDLMFLLHLDDDHARIINRIGEFDEICGNRLVNLA